MEGGFQSWRRISRVWTAGERGSAFWGPWCKKKKKTNKLRSAYIPEFTEKRGGERWGYIWGKWRRREKIEGGVDGVQVGVYPACCIWPIFCRKSNKKFTNYHLQNLCCRDKIHWCKILYLYVGTISLAKIGSTEFCKSKKGQLFFFKTSKKSAVCNKNPSSVFRTPPSPPSFLLAVYFFSCNSLYLPSPPVLRSRWLAIISHNDCFASTVRRCKYRL